MTKSCLNVFSCIKLLVQKVLLFQTYKYLLYVSNIQVYIITNSKTCELSNSKNHSDFFAQLRSFCKVLEYVSTLNKIAELVQPFSTFALSI